MLSVADHEVIVGICVREMTKGNSSVVRLATLPLSVVGKRPAAIWAKVFDEAS